MLKDADFGGQMRLCDEFTAMQSDVLLCVCVCVLSRKECIRVVHGSSECTSMSCVNIWNVDGRRHTPKWGIWTVAEKSKNFGEWAWARCRLKIAREQQKPNNGFDIIICNVQIELIPKTNHQNCQSNAWIPEMLRYQIDAATLAILLSNICLSLFNDFTIHFYLPCLNLSSPLSFSFSLSRAHTIYVT